jgi:ABC-type polysaccharide/polyol phosphate export permease
LAAALATINPLYYLLAVPRDLLISGTTQALSGYLPSATMSVVLLGLAWQLFHLAESRLAERI